MDQNYTNNQNDFLWTLLANPANNAHEYTFNLQRLVNDFPQSGILQAMLAHASDDKNLKQASAYFNPKSLYKLVNSPSSFIGVSDEKIIYQSNILSNGHSVVNMAPPVFTTPEPEPLQDAANTANENYFSEHAVVDTEPGNHLHIAEDQPETGHENTLHLTDAVTDAAPVVYTTLNESFASRLPEAPPAENPPQPLYTTLNESFASRPAETEGAAPVENVVAETIPESPIVHNAVVAESYEEHEAQITAAEAAAADAIEPVAPIEEAPVIAQPAPQPEKPIEEETFDEITGIEQISVSPQISHPVEPEPVTIPEEAPKIEPPVYAETRQQAMDNIATPDFLNFNRSFRGQPPVVPIVENSQEPVLVETQPVVDVASPVETPPVFETPAPAVETAPEKEAEMPANDTENQDVSKYHDEKMPYTFMWWLDKTRKEHAAIYQPYVTTETRSPVSKPKATGDDLQQQYYENIFHITSFDDLSKNNGPRPAPFIVKRKEQAIIERFIKEEPQIRPQSSDKLDNENKAKKSSEDRDEMVTETLAAIYSDQMLYHKAIASYKKLMLKFPEKSRYFASKIEQLEKKTN